MKQINRPKYHLSDSSSVPLQAMRLRAVNSVLLTKVEDRWCDLRKLMLYFGNKQRSGASDVKDVEIKGRGKAIVTFQDTRSEPNSKPYCCNEGKWDTKYTTDYKDAVEYRLLVYSFSISRKISD